MLFVAFGCSLLAIVIDVHDIGRRFVYAAESSERLSLESSPCACHSIYCQCFGANQHITTNFDAQAVFLDLNPMGPVSGS